MKLDVKTLTRGLEFHGEVEGKRQRYFVLSSPRQYFVMSLSRSKRDAGNFNLVGKAAARRPRRYRARSLAGPRPRERRRLPLPRHTRARRGDPAPPCLRRGEPALVRPPRRARWADAARRRLRARAGLARGRCARRS